MANEDEMSVSVREPPARGPYENALDYLVIGLAVWMMLLGLRHWAIIIGLLAGPAGGFEAMSTPLKLATMYLAVADLVAAVGLWMRVAWGKVIWIIALVSQIAFHTVFIATFGSAWLIVALQVLSFAAFVALTILARRQPVT